MLIPFYAVVGDLVSTSVSLEVQGRSAVKFDGRWPGSGGHKAF